MLDPFKRTDFIEYFIKEEKNHVGWYCIKSTPSNIKNTCRICLKWFTIQYLILNTILNVDFNVSERSNIYSNVFIKNNKR